MSYAKTCVLNSNPPAPKATWTTRNATGMAISIDNPDLVAAYGKYAASGSLAMPAIACRGNVGDVITHRYDFWTMGGKGTADHRIVDVSITIV
ncbi:MAG: hypothetical protein IPM11_06080 [Micropruina sp.]|nr:hypothetical protein [Micropruina sp.]